MIMIITTITIMMIITARRIRMPSIRTDQAAGIRNGSGRDGEEG
jgi:hypothetical protein